MKSQVFKSCLLFASLIVAANEADAGTIIKVGLGGTGPDVALVNGVFGTVSDGVVSPGDQETDIDYVGDFAFLADILADASFSLAGVSLVGLASFGPGTISQATTGGSFSLYDSVGSLVLAGDFAAGVITGALNGSTGSFFNTTDVTFTGGSLLSALLTTPAGLSLALSGIVSNQGNGLSSVCPIDDPCSISDFTANATGLIEGAPVPEPFTAGLIITGLAAGAAVRRKGRI